MEVGDSRSWVETQFLFIAVSCIVTSEILLFYLNETGEYVFAWQALRIVSIEISRLFRRGLRPFEKDITCRGTPPKASLYWARWDEWGSRNSSSSCDVKVFWSHCTTKNAWPCSKALGEQTVCMIHAQFHYRVARTLWQTPWEVWFSNKLLLARRSKRCSDYNQWQHTNNLASLCRRLEEINKRRPLSASSRLSHKALPKVSDFSETSLTRRPNRDWDNTDADDGVEAREFRHEWGPLTPLKFFFENSVLLLLLKNRVKPVPDYALLNCASVLYQGPAKKDKEILELASTATTRFAREATISSVERRLWPRRRASLRGRWLRESSAELQSSGRFSVRRTSRGLCR